MLALTQDRRLYAWGGNAAGQLGLGHLQTVDTPSHVRLAHGIDAVAAGASHSLALTTAGEVMAWGSNNHGQLGQDGPEYSTVPLPVALPERAQAVAAGMYFSLALGNSGHVYAWGWNHLGQLGLDDRDDRRPTGANTGAVACAVHRSGTGARGRAGLRRALRMGQQR